MNKKKPLLNLKHFSGSFKTFIILILFFLSSCYSTQFTQSNIMKLKVGMTSEEVIKIFGNPYKTEASTCGGAYGRPWRCIIWKYGEWKPRLTFQTDSYGNLTLNSWDL